VLDESIRALLAESNQTLASLKAHLGQVNDSSSLKKLFDPIATKVDVYSIIRRLDELSAAATKTPSPALVQTPNRPLESPHREDMSVLRDAMAEVGRSVTQALASLKSDVAGLERRLGQTPAKGDVEAVLSANTKSLDEVGRALAAFRQSRGETPPLQSASNLAEASAMKAELASLREQIGKLPTKSDLEALTGMTSAVLAAVKGVSAQAQTPTAEGPRAQSEALATKAQLASLHERLEKLPSKSDVDALTRMTSDLLTAVKAFGTAADTSRNERAQSDARREVPRELLDRLVTKADLEALGRRVSELPDRRALESWVARIAEGTAGKSTRDESGAAPEQTPTFPQNAALAAVSAVPATPQSSTQTPTVAAPALPQSPSPPPAVAAPVPPQSTRVATPPPPLNPTQDGLAAPPPSPSPPEAAAAPAPPRSPSQPPAAAPPAPPQSASQPPAPQPHSAEGSAQPTAEQEPPPTDDSAAAPTNGSTSAKRAEMPTSIPDAYPPKEPDTARHHLPPNDPRHVNAARVARVMVADLNLYNKQAVEEGIRQNDFFERNKEALGDMRATYEARVPQDVRDEWDHLGHAIRELIANKRKQWGLQ
jgi:hypothetical protein